MARNGERLKGEVAKLKDQGVDAVAHVCDVVDVEKLDRIIRQESDDGGIDVLNYNAITLRTGIPLLQTPLEAFQPDMMVGLGSAMVAARAAIPKMKQRGHGTLIFSGGDTGVDPWYLLPTAGAVKAGLRNFTQCLTRDPDCDGLRIAYVDIDAHIVGDVGRDIAEIYWNLHNDAGPPRTWDVKFHRDYDRPYPKESV
jgi:NAD(P)-dependent dehydrogenase (short-subunit alcohol dehydrogenase family)